MKVLLVEDDPSLREGMAEVIADLAEVRTVGSMDPALKALREERFDLVMADLRIAGASTGGKTILEAARRRLQPVVIVSALASEEIRRALQPFEADAILGKPFQLEELTAVVERFLALRGDLERLSQQRPAESAWTEASAGVQAVGLEPSAQAPAWVRLLAGASGPWPVTYGPSGGLLVEGDLEIAGEKQQAPQYFFLSSNQPRVARTEKGCLVVSLPLRG